MPTKLAFTAAMASAAMALFAGCSGGAPTPSSGLPSAGPQQTHPRLLPNALLASGIDPRFVGPTAVLPQQLPPKRAKVERRLFVSNLGNAVIVLNNKAYKQVGEITTGVNDSDGVWADHLGNVYVANILGKNVTEYKRGSGSPTCTYSSKLHDPINVTTDDAGDVYVADFNFQRKPGYIYKYAQCSNTVATRYTIDKGPEGVAVDKSGNLFVSYYNGGIGGFEEFIAGSIVPIVLQAVVGSPGGIVLDNNQNIIADDQTGEIDIIAPPYRSAVPLVTGLNLPFHDALNKTETLLFSANYGSATVTVYSYPSGTLVTTLGSSNGISVAEGVADSQ
jgi:hypothetical protein